MHNALNGHVLSHSGRGQRPSGRRGHPDRSVTDDTEVATCDIIDYLRWIFPETKFLRKHVSNMLIITISCKQKLSFLFLSAESHPPTEEYIL